MINSTVLIILWRFCSGYRNLTSTLNKLQLHQLKVPSSSRCGCFSSQLSWPSLSLLLLLPARERQQRQLGREQQQQQQRSSSLPSVPQPRLGIHRPLCQDLDRRRRHRRLWSRRLVLQCGTRLKLRRVLLQRYSFISVDFFWACKLYSHSTRWSRLFVLYGTQGPKGI